MIAGFAATARAQQSSLGKVVFPTSGSEKAQQHFIRGVAALHSFWYEEALDAFREATKVEPEFMMGYWGEAMAHNHPLWSEQDAEAARKVIAKIKDSPKLTQRERAFLNAVKALYGEGDKRARDQAYSEAMEKMYHDYPDDLEVASFYSLSLLGLWRPGDKGYRHQAKAGAIALDVYQKNPDHPGAAHYIIHSFDDPEHAILALPAARRYAEIAPDAHHARHMPSHIFLQLGMWPEAAASNEAAWAVSDAWVRRKNLSISLRDYHSLHWLLYVYLQQGRYSKAEELLSLMQKTMRESKYDNKLRPNYYANNYANMASAFIIETERWDLASKLFEPVEGEAGDSGGEHAGHSGPQPAPSGATQRRSNIGQVLPTFTRGFASAARGSAEAEKSLEKLRDMRKESSSPDAYRAKPAEIRELEVAALVAASKKSYDQAVELMKKAIALEEDMAPPSGPPSLVKPSHELFGEILLAAGRPKEAAAQFATALLRQPNRARSLLGAARAAAASGDAKGATAAYSRFLKQWQQADPQLPELREAQDYLKQASAR
jgi:tetratricopeptide (TPR) repeat protein